MTKPTRSDPGYKQRGEGTEAYYEKEWYEDGKRKRKRITDNEYYDHLKSRSESNPKEESKSVPEPVMPSKMNAITKDGDITEIVGKIISAVPVSDEDGRVDITIGIQDIDGDIHEGIGMRSKGIRQLMSYLVPSELANEGPWTTINQTEDMDELQKIFEASLPNQPTLVFRVLYEDDGAKLFGAVSRNWVKVKVEQMEPIINEVFGGIEDAIISIMPDESGRHGGQARIVVPGMSNLFNLTFHVNAGLLDGFHAAHITAGCQILACMNQLTFDNRKIPGLTNQVSIHEKKVHAGSIESFNESLKSIFASATKEVTSMVMNAKNARLSDIEMKDLLTYFISKGRLTKSDLEFLEDRMGEEDIEQLTGTVYGLAMNVSYRGSHDEKLSDNKRWVLATVAGELLIVAGEIEKYLEIIEPVVTAYREEQKAKEEERKKKEEEKKKEE